MDLKLYPLDRQECEMRIASCKFFFPDFLDLKKFLVTLQRVFQTFRWMDNCRLDLQMERVGSSANCQRLEFAQIQIRKIFN